jgi:predicted enzyme related to lactoylglutathione lyase
MTDAAAPELLVRQMVLPVDDLPASLGFYCDALGFDVRDDIRRGPVRTVDIGRADQPEISLALRSTDTAIDNADGPRITLATTDLDRLFERLEACGAEILQEPIRHSDGVRDFVLLDPAGTIVHIREMPEAER